MTSPTAPELIAAVADALRIDESVAALHWRRLREAGLVTVGRPGKGGHHAKVTPRDLATLFLSLRVSDSAAQAVDCIKSINPEIVIIKESLPAQLKDSLDAGGLIGALSDAASNSGAALEGNIIDVIVSWLWHTTPSKTVPTPAIVVRNRSKIPTTYLHNISLNDEYGEANITITTKVFSINTAANLGKLFSNVG